MAEITSIREIKVKGNSIKMELTYDAQYNRDMTYFNNLDFVTAEGESDDAIEYLQKHLDEYLDDDYLDFTEVSIMFFKVAPNLDNVKFIDKEGYFKVHRKEVLERKRLTV